MSEHLCVCGAPSDEHYFDRTVCAAPCGSMHTRCLWCSRSYGLCVFEGGTP